MNRIFITGGTGLIGSYLANRLIDMGWEVNIFTRNPEKFSLPNQKLNYLKIGKTTGETAIALDGCTAIVNLAGASIAGARWTKKYKEKIYYSRIDTTQHLAEAISKCKNPPMVFVSSSAVGYYGNCGEKELDENAPPGNDFMAQVCFDWEKSTQKVSDVCRVVNPRFGVVLAPKGGALERLVLPFKFYMGGWLGSGRQWFPWIHIADAVEIIIKSIEDTKFSGAVNAVAPEIKRMKDFAGALGKGLRKPSWTSVPGIVLKLALGEGGEFLLSSQKVLPKKLSVSGYRFRYPELKSAFSDLV